MQEFSKYRVITAGLILMFVFVVAAIYSNTKDIADQKMQQAQTMISNKNTPNSENTIEVNPSTEFQPVQNNNENGNQDDINSQISTLKERIDNLEQALSLSQKSNDASAVDCTIKGVVDGEHFVPLSGSEAIQESKENNKEVVITCLFK